MESKKEFNIDLIGIYNVANVGDIVAVHPYLLNEIIM